jgi:hypothetical protein
MQKVLTLPVHAKSVLITAKLLTLGALREPQLVPENRDSLQRKLVGLCASQHMHIIRANLDLNHWDEWTYCTEDLEYQRGISKLHFETFTIAGPLGTYTDSYTLSAARKAIRKGNTYEFLLDWPL